jgi:hypothetical protein
VISLMITFKFRSKSQVHVTHIYVNNRYSNLILQLFREYVCMYVRATDVYIERKKVRDGMTRFGFEVGKIKTFIGI